MVGRKKFSGFPKGWPANSRGSGGHSPPDTELQFSTTSAVFTKLLSNYMIVINNLCTMYYRIRPGAHQTKPLKLLFALQ